MASGLSVGGTTRAGTGSPTFKSCANDSGSCRGIRLLVAIQWPSSHNSHLIWVAWAVVNGHRMRMKRSSPQSVASYALLQIGRVAYRLEGLCKQGVAGSIPVRSIPSEVNVCRTHRRTAPGRIASHLESWQMNSRLGRA
jgi:hypothetical protein